MTITSLAEKACQHARHLATTIGPRPAGSPAEKQARDYIAGQLETFGYQVERTAAPFAPSPALHYPSLVGALALAGCGWALARFPWLALGLPFLIAALPQCTIWVARHRKPTAKTENVFACTKNINKETVQGKYPFTALILCAHVDSARALPFRSRFWLRLHSRTMDILQRIAVMLSLLGVLQWVGFGLPAGLLEVAAVLAVLVALIWLFMQVWGFWRPCFSPGAVDNASGVGVLLALAEQYALDPPPHLNLGFLFTGAEETGAHGALAFTNRFPLDKQKTALIVLDMVGAGNTLRYIAADGVYFPMRTDPCLNRLIKEVSPQALPLNETLRSGDHAVFIQKGFSTTALQTSGSAQAELAYHTVHDTADLLDSQALEMTLQCIRDVCSLPRDY
ncbi:MAG: M28 family peptidase [Anaerolineales bacterium]|nr:M28 family peptidase [Anaerolineales bacterium]